MMNVCWKLYEIVEKSFKDRAWASVLGLSEPKKPRSGGLSVLIFPRELAEKILILGHLP